MEEYTLREQITEVINKLFVYTDLQKWDDLQTEVFTETVEFDMSTMGGEKSDKSSKSICDGWKIGFKGLDAVNHLAGNYLITVLGEGAEVFAYATATHFKASATKGKTREFTGSYDLHLIRTQGKWKIDKFRYNLKYATGNLELE